MSWHFLERWIEKANHHSTLVGKFWITFLIVCRMVIVASVGDRVYSDEQSEFKCNTLQPGCTNVCFNKFSPISHLRFWSFQILLVATPSVMFVIYSGHDQKNTKAAAKVKKKKKAQQAKKRAQESKTVNKNPNSNNNNNNSCEEGKKEKRSSLNKSYGRGGRREHSYAKERYGKNKSNRDYSKDEENSVDARSQSLQALATVINFKNGEMANPVEASVMDDKKVKKESLPWQEMKWNSLFHLAENEQKCNKNGVNPSTMWIKPKEGSNKSINKDCDDRSEKKRALSASALVWGPPSSDDDNRNGKFTREIQSSLPEIDYHNGVDAVTDGYEKVEQLAMMSSHPPPDYPGNGWPQTDLDAYHMKDRRSSGMHMTRLGLVKTRTRKPRFTRHFHLYLLSVFVRLGLEAAFLLLQIKLYGFTVPALYKCQQWPCPNMVDCFISRPMEKTIFLYFMLVYTCICVLLNACEFKYLIWVYLFGRPKLMMKKKNDPEIGEGDIVYDSKGEPRFARRCMDQDSVYDECDLDEIADVEEYDALVQGGIGNFNRSGYDEVRERQKRQMYRRGGREEGKYLRDKHLQERMSDRRRHELDLILNDEEFQGEFDLDIAQNDPVDDILQMEFASTGGSGGGGGDDFNG